MKRAWQLLKNTFESNTRKSKIKMLRLANHHLGKLAAASGDPEILVMYNNFKGSVENYQALMTKWLSTLGIKKGNTKTWSNLLQELSKVWINSWQGKAFANFPRGTVQAFAIFPHNKKPFQKGKYDERIQAVETLVKTLESYPVLASLRAEVSENLASLEAARSAQNSKKDKASNHSSDLEKQRVALADIMDDNFCLLKVKYRKKPKMLPLFFDSALLHKQVKDTDAIFQFKSNVEGKMTAAIPLPAKLEMSTKAMCSLANQSKKSSLKFFFSANASASDGAVTITVPPNEQAERSAAEAAWSPRCGYLIIKNMGMETAQFSLRVTEAVKA